MTAQTDRLNTALAGRYRILRHLGEGGMATVYLCEDIKHDRQVALKLLKPELAAVLGAERFVQEIKTTAALQHPHILPLFDSGAADGFLFYVMPFIDGETLRAKLDRETQLGVEEAVRIARDVADALHYAHTRGIVHRDVKPENILLHDGRPMVADFGIALAVSAAAGGRMTETGLSLGTPHYMSPEQATAEKVISGRSDVYSLATVLYEMLTGNPPYTGASAQQIIMKIIAEPAEPVTKYRKSVPVNVAAALATALEKLPADRFASARTFAEALATSGYAGSAPRPIERVFAAGTWRARGSLVAVALTAVVVSALTWAGAVVLWKPRVAAVVAQVARYEVIRPGGKGGEFGSLAVSPDGARLVITGRGSADAAERLFLRARDQLEVRELPGTEGGSNPSFSPDGRKIVFMSGTLLKVADLSGGPVTTVADTGVGVPGVSWGYDGYIYLDVRSIGPLVRVPEGGGAMQAVSTLDAGTKELQHVWPDALPNGRGVIMTINRGGPGQGAAEGDAIAVLDLNTGRHRELLRGVFARYATSGHLLVVTREGTLLGVRFDQDKLEMRGAPVTLAEGVFVASNGTGLVNLSMSHTGTLWYTLGSGGAGREVGWSTRTGGFTPVEPAIVGNVLDASLSRDGTQLAYILAGDDSRDVWLARVGSRDRARLTFDRSYQGLSWHPNGTSLLVSRPPGELYTLDTDARSGPVPIPGLLASVQDARWAPDGARILYASQGGQNIDLLAITPGAGARADTLVATAAGERNPSVSPDGRWLAYQARAGASTDVQVRAYPNTRGALYQVSNAGGASPRWSRDGREIFYRGRGDSLVAVPVLPGPTFSMGAERALFSLRGVTSWDVGPDSQRFLLVRARDVNSSERLIVVENFHEELKARVKP